MRKLAWSLIILLVIVVTVVATRWMIQARDEGDAKGTCADLLSLNLNNVSVASATDSETMRRKGYSPVATTADGRACGGPARDYETRSVAGPHILTIVHARSPVTPACTFSVYVDGNYDAKEYVGAERLEDLPSAQLVISKKAPLDCKR